MAGGRHTLSTRSESFLQSLLRWKVAEGPRLPVRSTDGATIGFAKAIDRAILDTPHEISLLVQWRELHREMFLSRFRPDAEATARWLRETVFPLDDRILFWVEDESMAKVGHYGLKGLGSDSIELDNGIRGVPGHPGLFKAIEELMLAIAFDGLGAKTVKTSVLAGNAGALRLHHSLGLRVAERVPLRLEDAPSGGRLLPCHPDAPSEKTHELVTMEIDSASYAASGILKPDWRNHAE